MQSSEKKPHNLVKQAYSVHENIFRSIQHRTFWYKKYPTFQLNPILKLTAKMGSYIRHLHFTSALSDRLTCFHIHWAYDIILHYHNIGFKTWVTDILNILKMYNLEETFSCTPPSEQHAQLWAFVQIGLQHVEDIYTVVNGLLS